MPTESATEANYKRPPKPGEVVRLRTRTYLVEGVERGVGGHRVQMACLDDDAQGQPLEVVWELEFDGEVLDEEAWKSIGSRGFDPPPCCAFWRRSQDAQKRVFTYLIGLTQRWTYC